MKNYINDNHLDSPIRDKLLIDFIMEMVNKKNKSVSYKSQYRVLVKHVTEFSEKQDCVVYTNSVTEDFIEDFINYLRDKNMRNNTVKGLIEKIKAMTKKAGNYGRTSPST